MPSPPISTESTSLFAELERIATVRAKVKEFSTGRKALLEAIRRCKDGDSTTTKLRTLLDELTQEKMSHVEELRQINGDINTLEETIKQSEIAKTRASDGVRRLFGEVVRLQHQADQLGLVVGIEQGIREPALPREEISKLLSGSRQPKMHSNQPIFPVTPLNLSHFGTRNVDVFGQFSTRDLPTMIVSGEKSGALPGKNVDPGGGNSTGNSKHQQQTSPPMKICQSCQQQIHRNAPICPMCKSKSRSKNPKKPKRKLEDC